MAFSSIDKIILDNALEKVLRSAGVKENQYKTFFTDIAENVDMFTAMPATIQFAANAGTSTIDPGVKLDGTATNKLVIGVVAAPTATSNGNHIDIKAGGGGATSGAGGNVRIDAGSSGNGGTAGGGHMTIYAGSSNSNDPASNGGDIDLEAGSSGAGDGGSAYLWAGSADLIGGNVDIQGGYSSNGAGGNIDIVAGSGDGVGGGGNSRLEGGNSVGADVGGDVILNPGTGDSNDLNGQVKCRYGLSIVTSAGTPTADATRRGQLWIVRGGVGVADILYLCIKTAADAYEWKVVTLA